MSIANVKKLIRNGLLYRVKNAPLEAPVNKKQIAALLETLDNTMETDPAALYKLSSLVALINSQEFSNIGFSPIQALTSTNPLDYSGWSFNDSTLDWWFLSGQHKDYAFTFIVFRLPLCPPEMLENSEFQDAQLYTVSGGIGKRGGLWYSVPWQPTFGSYKKTSLQTASFSATLYTLDKVKQFDFAIDKGAVTAKVQYYPNGSTQLINVTITSIVTSTPQFNGPKGCQPCFDGVGTLYWSTPLLTSQLNFKIDGKVQENSTGIAWFDRQWLGAGIMKSMFLQSFFTVLKRFQKQSPTRWSWLTMQLNDARQFMCVVLWTAKNWPPTLGTSYPLSICNGYSTSGVKYNLKSSLQVTKFKTLQFGAISINFPVEYNITIDTGKQETFTLQAAFGDSIVYLPYGTPNWEGSGIVLQNGTQVGVGFLEYNLGLTTKDLDNIIIQNSGIPKHYGPLFSFEQRPTVMRTLGNTALITIPPLLLIFIVITLICCIRYKLKK